MSLPKFALIMIALILGYYFLFIDKNEDGSSMAPELGVNVSLSDRSEPNDQSVNYPKSEGLQSANQTSSTQYSGKATSFNLKNSNEGKALEESQPDVEVITSGTSPTQAGSRVNKDVRLKPLLNLGPKGILHFYDMENRMRDIFVSGKERYVFQMGRLFEGLDDAALDVSKPACAILLSQNISEGRVNLHRLNVNFIESVQETIEEDQFHGIKIKFREGSKNRADVWIHEASCFRKIQINNLEKPGLDLSINDLFQAIGLEGGSSYSVKSKD